MRLSFWSIFVLLTAVAVLNAGLRFAPVPARRDLAQFPAQIGEWRAGPDLPLDSRVLDLLRVSDFINRYYWNGATRLSLYIGYYRSQRAGETVHSPKNCLPSEGWEVMGNETRTLAIPGSTGRSFEVNRYLVQKDNQQVLVYYWYNAHGRTFASEYKGKFYLVWDTLRTGRTDGSFIRVMVPISGSANRADKDAAAFSQLIYPLLPAFLPN